MSEKALKRKPSDFHSNKTLRNFLVYEIGDRFLMKHASLYRGTMYDLGCGEAPYMDFFLQYVEHYIGVDWEQSRHATRENVVADLNKEIPVKSGVADVVISISVLEHLHQPQVMVGEAFRILKPGGAILLQVPWQWWVHEAPHDYFRYTPYGLTAMFKRAGFVDIEVEPQSGFFTMWILKFNYFSSRFVRGRRPFRWAAMVCLAPIWYFGQLVAPVLDHLDKNPSAEATGYFLTARKS